MGMLFHDIRYSLRTLRKSPGFAALAILTLALGIGANTAIFSIVDGVLLRPLPFQQPQRLVRIVDDLPGAGLHNIGMSVPELRDLQERAGIFDDVSAELSADMNITGAGHPERGKCWESALIIFRFWAFPRRSAACSDRRTKPRGSPRRW